jgi:hypothetical protein
MYIIIIIILIIIYSESRGNLIYLKIDNTKFITVQNYLKNKYK